VTASFKIIDELIAFEVQIGEKLEKKVAEVG